MLIGVHGKARAGKDTTANILKKHLKLEKYSFAAPIKQACNLIFGWDERHSDGALKEVTDPFWGISPRYAYQTMGTEWGRKLIAEDMWTRRAEKIYKEGTNLIIPDVRFENELDFIRRLGGTMIFVRRPFHEKAIALNTHVSEAGLEHLMTDDDITILNDGTVEVLEQKIVNDVIQILLNREREAA